MRFVENKNKRKKLFFDDSQLVLLDNIGVLHLGSLAVLLSRIHFFIGVLKQWNLSDVDQSMILIL